MYKIVNKRRFYTFITVVSLTLLVIIVNEAVNRTIVLSIVKLFLKVHEVMN